MATFFVDLKKIQLNIYLWNFLYVIYQFEICDHLYSDYKVTFIHGSGNGYPKGHLGPTLWGGWDQWVWAG